ncbi:MAG: polysaccharide biosynthesis protein [Candidatus Metalachnospira sp.]|nr:polysaccharide biosynthesis protein [Candidatus Metalachnospira sp.]
MSKKNIIKGAAILTAANLITRLMGFFNRVYMSNAIGIEGMGLYQLVMPIYILSWSITSSGFSTTISRITAKENAKRHYGNISKTVKVSVCICILISIIVSTVMYFGADFIAVSIIKDSRTAISMRILAIAVPFMAAGSCLRGYFLGMQQHVVPALSQVLEQTVRIIIIVVLSPLLAEKGLEYGCAAAITGVLLGEAISCLFTVICYKGFSKKAKYTYSDDLSTAKCTALILSMAIPLSATRISSSLLSALENILIPQKLQLYGLSSQAAMSTFGNITGMALPLIQLPSSFLMAISTTLVPALSETQATGSISKSAYVAEKSLKFTIVTGLCFTGIFMLFPHEICQIVYSKKELGDTLIKLAVICPFLYLQITMAGILNGLGCHNFIFKTSLLASAINLSFIYFIMPIIGTDAFIIGLTISLVTIVLLGIHNINRLINLRFSFIKSFFVPLICTCVSFFAVKTLTFEKSLSVYMVLFNMLIFCIIYVSLLLITGAITKRDITAVMPKIKRHH